MQESNQIFEKAFRERDRGRVEGDKKKVYVKLREPTLVGSKGEENSSRFESRKFGALSYKKEFQNTALEMVGKETLKPGYCIKGYRE